MFIAVWSGSWPCLCCGVWSLYKGGEDISDMIPDNLRSDEMGTYGCYEAWHFGDDWEEEWENYENGLLEEDWLKENAYWVDKICQTPEEKSNLYATFQAQDWRHGSCGGCI